MRSMFSSLSAAHIQALTSAQARNVLIEVVAETGSTNADLLARAGQLDGPVLRVAGRQTAGRGRAGRSWQAARDAALLCSLAWPLHRPLHALEGLTLAVGVVLAQVLEGFKLEVQLKWPNDVLLAGGKLAGILVETAPLPGGGGVWAVIGMGVNLAAPPMSGSPMHHPTASPAAQAPGLLQQRNAVLAALLDALATALPRFARAGLAPFVADWNRLHAHQDQEVVILDGDRMLHQGRAVGIDESGRLLLQTSQGVVPVTAGDVSLRPQAAWCAASLPLTPTTAFPSPLPFSPPCKG